MDYVLKKIGKKRPDIVVSGDDFKYAQIKNNINKQHQTLEKFTFIIYTVY